MNTLNRDGVTLAFHDVGTGTADPIVFIHGWGGSHLSLAAQQAHFSRHRRTVAVDLRGFGQSDTPHGDYTIASFADDVAWVARQLGLKRFMVVGHSMGGTVALHLAAHHADVVSAAVILDSFLFLPTESIEMARGAAALLGQEDVTPVLGMVAANLFAEGDDPAVREGFLADLAAVPRHVLASSFVSHIADYDPQAAAAACTVPLAYIGAERPAADLDRFRAACSHLHVGITIGSGHFAPVLVPGQVNAMIDDFDRLYVQTSR